MLSVRIFDFSLCYLCDVFDFTLPDFNQSLSNFRGTDQGISPDTLLSDYASWWLEQRKDEISASYYSNCTVAIKDIVENIGGYKLRELNPTIIHRFYDKLDKKEKTVTVVTAKPELRDVMKKKNMGYTQLTEHEGFNSATLCAALAGKHISLEYAKRLAD